ncbi:MAG: hypothetical protein M3Z04_19095, partial [Chloroflexota bacterium]|nr:hypothetical protein [Chloroflexota bacterium]
PLATPPVTLPGALPAPCHRTSFNNNRRFPETGQAVSGDFVNYWERNGGLPDQGYPISPLITEVSDLNGKPYQVQYFERAVFECHPENLGTAFGVLLSQLGTFQYRQQYPQGAPGQRPNGERPQVFAETGHTLGGEFRTYWETHGGKHQQGLPLSDEFTEVSALDGKPYTVQYFERAVFEYHPENVPPYRVLLSQLGTFRYRAKYPTPPAPPPVALPTAAPTGPQFLGYIAPGNTNCSPDNPGPLVAGGGYLFWPDAGSNLRTYDKEPALLGYDVSAGRQLSAAQPWNLAERFATDGRAVAWRESRPNQTPDPPSYGYDLYIHRANLRTGQEAPPWRLPQRSGRWAVGDGDTIYYTHILSVNTTEVQALSAYDGATGQTARIATAPPGSSFVGLMAGSGYLAWRVRDSDPQAYDRERLYLAPARNPTAATVIRTGRFDSLIISGDHLFWTRIVIQADGSYNELTDNETAMYTFSTGTTQVLDRGEATNLSVSEDRIAWRLPVNYYKGYAVTRHMAVLDLRTGQKRIYAMPEGTTSCVTLAGSALAYIRDPLRLEMLPELFLQPLP